MTAASPIRLRTRLVELEAEALATIAQLEGAIESIVTARSDANSDDEHDPEGATLAFERSQSDALATHARERLAEIRSALDRFHQGTYGTCERCGAAIALARLEARPFATRCVTCA